MSVLENVRHYSSVGLCFARLAVQRQLEYPLFLFSWFLMIPIQYFGWLWMLKVLIDTFQPLAGWTFPQVAFVYGLAQLSHGLMVVFFIQTWFIEQWVVRGEFDRLLLRPLNVYFHLSVVFINFIGLIDLIPGTIIFGYACRQLGFVWSAANTLKLGVIILGAMFIRAAIYTATGSVAFWTKRSHALVFLNLALLERTTLYPLSIYPYLFQAFLTFLVPIGFISFYPACGFLGQDTRTALPLDLAVWTPLLGLVTMLLAHAVFRAGLRRYESSGS